MGLQLPLLNLQMRPTMTEELHALVVHVHLFLFHLSNNHILLHHARCFRCPLICFKTPPFRTHSQSHNYERRLCQRDSSCFQCQPLTDDIFIILFASALLFSMLQKLIEFFLGMYLPSFGRLAFFFRIIFSYLGFYNSSQLKVESCQRPALSNFSNSLKSFKNYFIKIEQGSSRYFNSQASLQCVSLFSFLQNFSWKVDINGRYDSFLIVNRDRQRSSSWLFEWVIRTPSPYLRSSSFSHQIKTELHLRLFLETLFPEPNMAETSCCLCRLMEWSLTKSCAKNMIWANYGCKTLLLTCIGILFNLSAYRITIRRRTRSPSPPSPPSGSTRLTFSTRSLRTCSLFRRGGLARLLQRTDSSRNRQRCGCYRPQFQRRRKAEWGQCQRSRRRRR